VASNVNKITYFVIILQQILPKANRKFLAFLVAMMLKSHCKHLSLVQRTVSVMLYGNRSHKQVYDQCNVNAFIEIILV